MRLPRYTTRPSGRTAGASTPARAPLQPPVAAPEVAAVGAAPAPARLAAAQSVVVSSTFTHVEIDVILILLNCNLLRIISMYRHRLGPRTSRTSMYVDELTFVAVHMSDGFILLTCIRIFVYSVYNGSACYYEK